jgi:hypothetical protein
VLGRNQCSFLAIYGEFHAAFMLLVAYNTMLVHETNMSESRKVYNFVYFPARSHAAYWDSRHSVLVVAA